MIRYLFIICSLFFVTQCYSQWDFSGKIIGRGWFATDEEAPFWNYTNKSGRYDATSDYYGSVSGKARYRFNEKQQLEFGGNIGYSNGVEDDAFIEEAYVSYSNSWLVASLGSKRRPQFYNGLSVSNESILWSRNHRPLPGIHLETREPIFFSGDSGLGFEAMWSDYLMEEDRFVSKARLHHKSLHLVYKPNTTWRFTLGIRHAVQWGGNSQEHGKQPEGVKDYIRVVTGRAGGEDALSGEQINALGSHYGSYEFYIDRQFEDFKARFIYNSIFSDGSGSRLANFPDGRYGIFLDFENRDWVSSFIYELYYTKNQSQTRPHLWDNYFNNYIYASGYTYKNQVIGLPFFTTNYYADYPKISNVTRIGNNLITTHHFGISGFAFKKRPYKLLISFRNNHGHNLNIGVAGYEHFSADDPRGEIKLPRNIISTYFQMNIIDDFLILDAFIGADYSKTNKSLGGGINLRKSIF